MTGALCANNTSSSRFHFYLQTIFMTRKNKTVAMAMICIYIAVKFNVWIKIILFHMNKYNTDKDKHRPNKLSLPSSAIRSLKYVQELGPHKIAFSPLVIYFTDPSKGDSAVIYIYLYAVCFQVYLSS